MQLPFDEILGSALTPVTLISGVGLLLLSMTNRYTHATARVRSLMNEFRASPGRALRCEVDILYRRCKLLRNCVISMMSGLICSAAMVGLTVLEGFTGTGLDEVKSILLIGACLFLLGATMLFVADMLLSLRAIRLEYDELPTLKN
ncbi:MAG: DUF2721 domain-containing protein [Opitutales bacterium]